MKSKYLEKMSKLVESGLFTLNGNRMLVELIEEPERTTKSGLYTGVPKEKADGADRARVAVVLVVGPGYLDDDTHDLIKLPYKPGDTILINQFGVKLFSDFFGLADYRAGSIGMVTEDLVHGIIQDVVEFESILRG